MLYLSLLPLDFKPLSPASPNLALLGTNSKLKSKNTVKPFRTHSDYQQPKVLIINNNFREEEETEQVVSDNKIEVNSSDDKDDIKMKKVGKLIKKHHPLDKDGVVL
jgi:hypothetical protein